MFDNLAASSDASIHMGRTEDISWPWHVDVGMWMVGKRKSMYEQVFACLTVIGSTLCNLRNKAGRVGKG